MVRQLVPQKRSRQKHVFNRGLGRERQSQQSDKDNGQENAQFMNSISTHTSSTPPTHPLQPNLQRREFFHFFKAVLSVHVIPSMSMSCQCQCDIHDNNMKALLCQHRENTKFMNFISTYPSSKLLPPKSFNPTLKDVNFSMFF